MTTLSPTKARANLTSWLQAAARGEDIGILYDGNVIALRPVAVESTDYALREYGATEAQIQALSLTVHEEIKKDRRRGKLAKFSGNLESLLDDPSH